MDLNGSFSVQRSVDTIVLGLVERKAALPSFVPRYHLVAQFVGNTIAQVCILIDPSSPQRKLQERVDELIPSVPGSRKHGSSAPERVASHCRFACGEKNEKMFA